MINPHLFRAHYFRKSTVYGSKTYQAVLILGQAYFVLRADYLTTLTDPQAKAGLHKTATSAIDRAERVKTRWKRLYNAAVLAMVQEEAVRS